MEWKARAEGGRGDLERGGERGKTRERKKERLWKKEVGGRKAEVFVDRGKGKQAAAATSMAAPVSASGANAVF